MSNVNIIKSAYENFAAGNIPAVLESFSPDVTWHECQGFPWVEGDGIFTGADEIVQNAIMPILEQYDGFSIEVVDLIDGGDKIVMEGYYTGTYKATGKSFRANAVHIWTMKNGKVAEFFQSVDVATIVNP